MSIWANIRRKSLGQELSEEELSLIYPNDNRTTVLYDEESNGNEFSIRTEGTYPFIRIQTKNRKNPISVFSGRDNVTLEIDGKEYVLEIFDLGSPEGLIYKYSFNKEDDLVLGEHAGKAHSMDEMKELARLFIEKILKEEKRLFSDIMQ